MSRIIKFNAWDKFENKMIYWNDMIRTQPDEVYWLPEMLLNSARFVPLQFTGLKDKNGKEIYEGDIVKGVSANIFSEGEVRYYEIIWGIDSWHVRNTGFCIQELRNYCNNNIEIVGSIYENPELLQ